MVSEALREKLKNLSWDAYKSIGTPLEKSMEKIGKILYDELFPDKGRNIIIIWKNPDAEPLSKPFRESLKCPSFEAITSRLTEEERIIKNRAELKELIQTEYEREKIDVVLILDGISGHGGTVKMIKELVEEVIINYRPDFYFYCVFGPRDLWGYLNPFFKFVYVVNQELELDEDVKPSRLEWMVMSDIGDRFEDRSEDYLIETPLEYERNRYIKPRLEHFLDNIVEHSGSLSPRTEQLEEDTSKLAIVGAPIYLAQKEARQSRKEVGITTDIVFALLKVAQKADPRLKNYYGGIEIHERKKAGETLLFHNEKIAMHLDWGEKYGYFKRKARRWYFPTHFMMYYKFTIEPVVSEYPWYRAMAQSSFKAIYNPQSLLEDALVT